MSHARREFPTTAPSELALSGDQRGVRRLLETHELIMKAHLQQLQVLLENPLLAVTPAPNRSTDDAAVPAPKRSADDADASPTRKAARRAAADGASSDLNAIRDDLRAFAAVRDWDQFHTPRNLALALTGEVGELCECFQWKGDVACEPGLSGWSESKREHLGEELADCLCYLVRLADKCGVDLADATARKIERNAAKYPAALVRGSSKKYNEY